jgi:acetyltransferase-like isoleucine patch superfamily enzyme
MHFIMKFLYNFLQIGMKIQGFISICRLRFLQHAKVGRKITINGGLYLRGRGRITIGDNVTINSSYKANPIGGQTFTSLVCASNASLKIGSGCAISNAAIFCRQKIHIGENVYIGGDCRIYDTDFHSLHLANRLLQNDPDIVCASILIDDGAFIGASTVILKGVRIGKCAVIGAGSVVTKDVPDFEIWGGSPARFLKKLNVTE